MLGEALRMSRMDRNDALRLHGLGQADEILDRGVAGGMEDRQRDLVSIKDWRKSIIRSSCR
jgi:hypothetical protein